jgi:hypothetical protein
MAIRVEIKRQSGKRRWLITSGIILISTLLGISSISCQAPTPAVSWAADGVITTGEYQGQMNYGDYEIFWDSDEQYAYIGMRAKASGWVAVAIQPKPFHKETDTVMGFVEDGEVTVLDMFSTQELGPCALDTELGGTSDILEFGGKEDGDLTTIEFKRLLTTGDEYDGELLKGANTIMWAYTTIDDQRQKHINRGYGEIDI